MKLTTVKNLLRLSSGISSWKVAAAFLLLPGCRLAQGPAPVSQVAREYVTYAPEFQPRCKSPSRRAARNRFAGLFLQQSPLLRDVTGLNVSSGSDQVHIFLAAMIAAGSGYDSQWPSGCPAQSDNGVRRDVVPALRKAIRPMNDNDIDLGIVSQSKMHANVGGTQVARIGMHTTQKLSRLLTDLDARPDSIHVPLGLFQTNLHPVITVVFSVFI